MARAGAVAVAALILLGVAGCGGDDSSERDHAIAAARTAYAEAGASAAELDRGPCVAERLPGLSDWVADVAHDPRLPADDDPRNQCARYRDGEAHHFVELTPAGDLIRAQ